MEYASAHDPRLFLEADRRARLVDKRPLVELVDSILYISSEPSAGGGGYHHPSSVANGGSAGILRSPPVPESPPAISPDVTPILESLSSFLGPAMLNSAAAGSPSVRLTYEDIVKPRSTAYQALYASLPRQCTNCGLRFPNTPEGGAKLEAHLDAHFRRNIRLKDKSKKVFARVWLPRENDWINNVEAQASEQPGRNHQRLPGTPSFAHRAV